MKTVFCFRLDQVTYSFVFMNPKGLRIIPGQKMKIRLEKTKIDILLNFLVFFHFSCLQRWVRLSLTLFSKLHTQILELKGNFITIIQEYGSVKLVITLHLHSLTSV